MISELNTVCYDSTAALIVACSFCVQSTILSALIRSLYSRGSTTAATATAARTKTRTGRRLCQQRQLQGCFEIGNGSRGNNLRRLLQSVHRGATCWLSTGAVRAWNTYTVYKTTQWWQRKLLEIDLSVNHTINHYFIVRPNVVQRAGQVSLPHVAISKTERNRTTNIKPMSSSYNTPWIKHKLVLSFRTRTLKQVTRCPPLRYGAALSSLAMSGLAFSVAPIAEHQAPLLADKTEKLISLKTYVVCKHTKLKTTITGNNTFLIHTTQKTNKFAMQQVFRYPVPVPAGF